MNSIPTIDISPLIHLNERSCNNTSTINDDDDRLKNTIKQIKHACTTVGFFAIINHGVSNGSIANAWDTSTQFFDCDTSIKESVPMTPTYPYGYENFESLGIERSVSSTASSADNLLVDSKETFSIGPSNSELSGMPPRQFPSKPIALESALSQYFNDMEKLAQVLFRGLALALELNEDWFLLDGRFTSEGRQSALRVLNYPALEYNKEEEEKEKIHIRAGAHTDYGAMTILKSGGPGLQLRLANNNDETNSTTTDDSSSWIDVPHLERAFIINLGDLMQRWTNDRWKSTLHRVIAVSDDDESSDGFHSARRQSMAFFVNMNGNAIIRPIESCINKDHPSQYGDIKASDYLINRHRQSMSIKD